ncbi:hypothetical protein [Actinomadura flavalba]|uniref:hypothetical protein n=1 Tax=Actinomadura flavalba TaxID=1120938 RepID=UPI0003619431|nr:hypothetical protein [Actinomadura flavalba]
MRRTVLSLGTAALVAAPLWSAPAASAAPADKAPASFTDVKAPSPVAAYVDGVDLTARLVELGADGTPQPVTDRPAVVLQSSTDKVTWTARADALVTADGFVRGWRLAEHDAYWRLSYAGDADTSAAVSAPVFVDVRIGTRFHNVDIGPEPVAPGGTLNLRGSLRRTLADGEVPAKKGAKLTVQFQAEGSTTWQNVRTTTTDGNGRFATTATATRAGGWRLVYPGSETHLLSVSGDDRVAVGVPTRFGAFNAAPEPVAKGRPIKVAGRLDRRPAGTWLPAKAGAVIQVQFKADGASGWTTLGTTKTTSGGTFAVAFPASRDGHWRALYAGSTTHFDTGSPADHVDVR